MCTVYVLTVYVFTVYVLTVYVYSICFDRICVRKKLRKPEKKLMNDLVSLGVWYS